MQTPISRLRQVRAGSYYFDSAARRGRTPSQPAVSSPATGEVYRLKSDIQGREYVHLRMSSASLPDHGHVAAGCRLPHWPWSARGLRPRCREMPACLPLVYNHSLWKAFASSAALASGGAAAALVGVRDISGQVAVAITGVQRGGTGDPSGRTAQRRPSAITALAGQFENEQLDRGPASWAGSAR